MSMFSASGKRRDLEIKKHMSVLRFHKKAPTVVTALLATVPKIGVFSILVQVGPVTNVVVICAVLSIVYRGFKSN